MVALEEWSMEVTFVVIVVTMLAFLTDRFPLDLVATSALMVLQISGVLTVKEALSGFASGVTATFVGLFIVGDGLMSTGVAARVGDFLSEKSRGNATQFMVAMMCSCAMISAVMSSTGAVALCIPIVMDGAEKLGKSPSTFLMPIAFASLLGGMTTLIGTPPNLVVADALEDKGLEPFGFFDFAPAGLVMFVTGVLYMMSVGKYLMPRQPVEQNGGQRNVSNTFARSMHEYLEEYELSSNFFQLIVKPTGSIVGTTLKASKLRTQHGLTVLAIGRPSSHGATIHAAMLSDTLLAGDIIYCMGQPETVNTKSEELGLISQQIESASQRKAELEIEHSTSGLAQIDLDALDGGTADFTEHVGVVETIVVPSSSFCGLTLSDCHFRQRYNLTVIGIKRIQDGNKPTALPSRLTMLKAGDVLLFTGPWSNIHRLLKNDEFVVMGLAAEALKHRQKSSSNVHAMIAALILVTMIALMVARVLPAAIASILAAIAMLATGCVKSPYAAVKWDAVIMIGAMLPVATALKKSGGVAQIAHGLDSISDPTIILLALFGLTVVFSQMVSNTATTMIMCPFAMEFAERLDVSPKPFLMAISIAASTAFCTPVASPVNVLVYGPGQYKFCDFMKVGTILAFLAFGWTALLIPLIFPF